MIINKNHILINNRCRYGDFGILCNNLFSHRQKIKQTSRQKYNETARVCHGVTVAVPSSGAQVKVSLYIAYFRHQTQADLTSAKRRHFIQY